VEITVLWTVKKYFI